LLEIAHLHERTSLGISLDSSSELPAPQLAVAKTGTLREFLSSLVALFRGPAPPKEFAGDAYFRDCWIDQKLPKHAFATAIVLQAMLVLFPPPIWNIQPARNVSVAAGNEITWYGPARDFPGMRPAPRVPKPTSQPEVRKSEPPPRGADAFHPRQTILAEPLHPNHPRQTLVRPKAPPEPPKILPELPNIVQLAASQPERPRLQLTAKELTNLRPKSPASVAVADAAAPEIVPQDKQAGVITIASSSKAPSKPLLPVSPMSAPRAITQKTETNGAAPDIGGRNGETETFIALSATPAPAAPPAMPAGNLSARVSISPDGPQSGNPGGTASGSASIAAKNEGAGSGNGPEGIFISGGSNANAGSASGLGLGPAPRGTGSALPARPVPRASIAPEISKPSAVLGASSSAPKLGLSPQEVLGAKRVYTLHVNMPNLTSASGSWILNFAELNETPPVNHMEVAAVALAGPVPLRKVDPKYPPEFRTSHVDGEVVLYAIIRKDGSVDSIQLVHSVDPSLDANAMEALAQWKFRPAEKQGEPVDLEAVVRIPFRSRGPVF
jgi:TonB family protein